MVLVQAHGEKDGANVVDYQGNPADRTRTGGWLAAGLILAVRTCPGQAAAAAFASYDTTAQRVRVLGERPTRFESGRIRERLPGWRGKRVGVADLCRISSLA
uniref:Uncharacterized protein n=1 Tax=Kalanchoe fedtschenkoi TaxID=63787 RepID=A0A7N0TB39_KALFE